MESFLKNTVSERLREKSCKKSCKIIHEDLHPTSILISTLTLSSSYLKRK